MKRLTYLFPVLTVLLFGSCQSTTPDKFFEVVMLNTNLVADFRPSEFGKRLEQETKEFPDIPSSKKNGNEAQQIVEVKVMTIEKAISNIKKLNASDDDMKTLQDQSIKLFETVLPVYKNEYTAYAKLCDEKATSEQKENILVGIERDHLPAVESIMESLYGKGQEYAKKHYLNVSWGN